MKCKAEVTQRESKNSDTGVVFLDSDSLNERLDGEALAFMKSLKRKHERSYG